MQRTEPGEALRRLMKIMATLRSPQGCPWDAAQTPQSLQPYLLEETYEVLEALDAGNPDAIREELGDLLLQVVFLSRIFEEEGTFGMGEVASAIAEKLVRRHPHVFGDAPTGNLAALDAQWERIKASEKKDPTDRTSPLGKIPRQMPALLRAAKIADKTARMGVGRGQEPEPPPLEQGVRELNAAVEAGDREAAGECMGQLLFTIADLGRTMDLDAEQCLRRTLDQVTRRFDQAVRGSTEEAPHDLDELWREAISK